MLISTGVLRRISGRGKVFRQFTSKNLALEQSQMALKALAFKAFGFVQYALYYQLVEKVFSTSCLRFQNFQKVLKSIDLNDAGHPSFPFSCLLTEELFLSKASGFDFGKLQREIPILSDGESTGLPPEPSAAVPVGKRRKSLSGA